MENLKITPRSIIKKGGLRRIDISAYNEIGHKGTVLLCSQNSNLETYG